MPRPRRMYVAKKVYFASARIAQGLPLVPDDLINSVIKGILARALHFYPIKICDVVFMNNHFHIIFICLDAYEVKEFFRYIKGEIATAINKLTGRRGPVWEGRTDTPELVTVENIIDKIIYLYTNPQDAGHVDKIEDYPGLSTWDMLVNGTSEEKCPWYPTRELKKIYKTPHEYRDRSELLKALNEDEDREVYMLKFEPLAWLDHVESDLTVTQAVERIVEGVRQVEEDLRGKRKGKVIGKYVLRLQSMYRRYKPKKYGQRVSAICSDLELRKHKILERNVFLEKCYRVYQKWKLGDFSEPFPPEGFPPPGYKLASAI